MISRSGGQLADGGAPPVVGGGARSAASASAGSPATCRASSRPRATLTSSWATDSASASGAHRVVEAEPGVPDRIPERGGELVDRRPPRRAAAPGRGRRRGRTARRPSPPTASSATPSRRPAADPTQPGVERRRPGQPGRLRRCPAGTPTTSSTRGRAAVAGVSGASRWSTRSVGGSSSQGVEAALAGTDPDDLLDAGHPDLAVTDLAGPGGGRRWRRRSCRRRSRR